MSSPMEYHISVRQRILASVAFLSLLVLVFVSIGHAQINGTPASVTSPGFGGQPINGMRSSVTSVGPNGYAPYYHQPFSTTNPPPPFYGNGDGQHHHHYVEYNPPVVYAVPVPYAVDIGATEDEPNPDAENSDANYQGGPTVLDRRGSGPGSYIPPARNATGPRAPQDTDAPAVEPDPPQEPTLLIFKDGHKVEVGNYAIVGPTLFDMTPGHHRKIPIADLDLEATRQKNDERGVTFQVPPLPRAK
jgi:hypothetical protein